MNRRVVGQQRHGGRARVAEASHREARMEYGDATDG